MRRQSLSICAVPSLGLKGTRGSLITSVGLQSQIRGSLLRVVSYIVVLTLIAMSTMKITVVLYGGSFVLYELLEINRYVSGVATLTVVYTTAGGLRAVMFTEVFQALMLLIGCAALDIFAMVKGGGWGGLRKDEGEYYRTRQKHLRDSDYPWLGEVGHNKDFTRTLDAFHNAIDGAVFGTALGI